MSNFLTPLLKKDAPAHVLRNARSGGLVAASLETAFDSKTRNRGLLGRDGLDRDSALVLAPCNSIHTFFMRFPIDVAFVARNGRVVKTATRIRPWRISLSVTAFATIEFAAGTLERVDLRRGDTLEISPKLASQTRG
jgi:uncharacterized protein